MTPRIAEVFGYPWNPKSLMDIHLGYPWHFGIAMESKILNGYPSWISMAFLDIHRIQKLPWITIRNIHKIQKRYPEFRIKMSDTLDFMDIHRFHGYPKFLIPSNRYPLWISKAVYLDFGGLFHWIKWI